MSSQSLICLVTKAINQPIAYSFSHWIDIEVIHPLFVSKLTYKIKSS